MVNKNLYMKGILLGIGLFVIAEIISFTYTSIVRAQVPAGSSFTLGKEALASSTKIVYWICRPFSHILRIFFVNSITGLFKISIVNIIGWIGLSTLILYLKNRGK